MDYHQFLRRQEEIYAIITTKGAEGTQGTRADSSIKQRNGGFSIAIRWDDETNQKLAKIAAQIINIVPGYLYEASEFHTTIGMSERGPAFAFDPHNDSHKKTLEVYCHIGQALQAMGEEDGCRNEFGRYLLGLENVVVAGIPNEQFVTMVEVAKQLCAAADLEFAPAEMAHTSLFRFAAKKDARSAQHLFKFLNDAVPPGMAYAKDIVVWYGQSNPPPKGDRRSPVYNVIHKVFPLKERCKATP